MITHRKPFGNHGYPQGLGDLIFGDSDAKKSRHKAEQTASDNAARLDRQEKMALEKERTQTEALNARRRATFGRSGRQLLLQGSELGVGGNAAPAAAAPKSDTLG